MKNFFQVRESRLNLDFTTKKVSEAIREVKTLDLLVISN